MSVIRDLCVATVSGRGPDGYRDALERLQEELAPTDLARRAERVLTELAPSASSTRCSSPTSSTCAG